MLIARDDVKNGIVFCNRKSEVDIVAKSLKTHGLDAAPIHGDLDQTTRMRTLESFRKGELKLLVASDVAARGLDIPDVSHVFNFDVPHHADDYVHRIGRTGRAGKADSRNLDKVLKLIGKAPEELLLDADWANIKDEPRNARGGSRGGARERSAGAGRDRDRRPRPVPVHGEHASTEPFDPTAEVVATAEAPRPERPARSRGRRGGSEPRPAPAETAAPEAAAPAPTREEARPPRGERPERRPERDRGPRTQRAERAPRDEPRREHPDRSRAPRDRDADDDGVVGFGHDVPAFLAKRPPVRSDD
jgi:superfamily II DNA/RNA helicase